MWQQQATDRGQTRDCGAVCWKYKATSEYEADIQRVSGFQQCQQVVTNSIPLKGV